jgi:hypothetical protein
MSAAGGRAGPVMAADRSQGRDIAGGPAASGIGSAPTCGAGASLPEPAGPARASSPLPWTTLSRAECLLLAIALARSARLARSGAGGRS